MLRPGSLPNKSTNLKVVLGTSTMAKVTVQMESRLIIS